MLRADRKKMRVRRQDKNALFYFKIKLNCNQRVPERLLMRVVVPYNLTDIIDLAMFVVSSQFIFDE